MTPLTADRTKTPFLLRILLDDDCNPEPPHAAVVHQLRPLTELNDRRRERKKRPLPAAVREIVEQHEARKPLPPPKMKGKRRARVRCSR